MTRLRVHADLARIGEAWERDVTIDGDASGTIERVTVGGTVGGTDERADLRLGVVVPGVANTHSHAFHRLLRGRTNDGGGTFWTWRERMYGVAASLTPDRLREVATALYTEMVSAGYTSVGEFHYLHHRPDGRTYAAHDMEVALAEAAATAGIALTLLDTCYLRQGFDGGLAEEQRRFTDRSVASWAERWMSLREVLALRHPGVVLGAAVHSVRAVSPADIAALVERIPADVPLHVHLSEQPQENVDCLAATGLTPTGVLERAGALSSRSTVVHATHLTPADIAALGSAAVTVSLCPTTEADLGDGLGVAADLSAAGARLAIGSDQHVLIDPFAELRGVEWFARLRAERRGVFTPAELWRAGTSTGFASLNPAGVAGGTIAAGARMDLVELDDRSVRTAGSTHEELVLTATAADVRTVIARGAVVTGERAAQ